MTTLRSLPLINVLTLDPVDDLSVVPELSVIPEVTVVTRPASPTAASRHVMGLLADGVQLSLLMDLADPEGMSSRDIASSEVDSRSLLGDLLTFRAHAAEGAGRGAQARAALRTLRFG